MIFADFMKAVAQLSDRRFRGVLLRGVLLTGVLLGLIFAFFLWVIQAYMPTTIDLPLIGPIAGLGTLASWGAGLVMVVLSVFLMVPVASAFTSLFLDEVAQAVEDKHYPGLPAARKQGFGDAALETASFLLLVLVVNALALIFYVLSGPFAPLMFWAVNGLLLGREYFTLVASRRMDRAAATGFRKRHWLRVWGAGVLMAAPLSIPFVNLLIPVLGAATFTHLFHRLNGGVDR